MGPEGRLGSVAGSLQGWAAADKESMRLRTAMSPTTRAMGFEDLACWREVGMIRNTLKLNKTTCIGLVT